MRQQTQLILLFIMLSSYLTQGAQIISIPMKQNRYYEDKTQFDNQNLRGVELAEDGSNVTAHVENISNRIYTLEIQVGEKKEPYSLLMDTGSNILWIPTTQCADKLFVSYYDCQASDGCILSNPLKDKSIYYGKGSVSGQIGQIKISLGNLTPIQESLVLVNKVNDQPKSNYSGLIGLGPQNELNDGKTTWIQNYFKQGLISSPEFSVYLDFDNKSELTLGGINPKYKNENSAVSYHTVEKGAYWWAISFNKFQIGNLFTSYTTGKLVLDTGFSFMGTDEAIWIDIAYAIKKVATIQIVNESLIAVIKCSSVTWPNLTFSLPDENGTTIDYDLEPSFYLTKVENDVCILPFQRIKIDGIKFAVGQQFLRKYMAVYSYEPLRVGVAKSINSPPSSDDDSGLPTYAIILIAVGGVLVLSGLIYISYKYCKKRKVPQAIGNKQSNTSSIHQSLV